MGGKKSIKKNQLLELYESLNFQNIIVHIQSGNIIFSSKKQNPGKIAHTIEQAFEDKFKFSVSVILRTFSEFTKIIKDNPFTKDNTLNPDKLHVTFLRDVPKKNALEKLQNIKSNFDKYKIKNREVYLYCPNGYGRTKLTNNFFERVLSTQATTRKWLRVLKLVELAETLYCITI